MSEKIEAPWTPEQVAGLNAYQDCGWVHPFTCAEDTCRSVLHAIEAGWVCMDPTCPTHPSEETAMGVAVDFPCVQQRWAHAFMAEGCPDLPSFLDPSPQPADDPA